MELLVYVVTYDTGFAPNPFHDCCTLATCKPVIRRCAEVGDWVIGVGSKRNNQEGKLVYAMQVKKIMCFDDYWADDRFQAKKPKKPKQAGDWRSQCGDNIYHRHPTTGAWFQSPSYHSNPDGTPNIEHITTDTDSPRVLISHKFVYFGQNAIAIPSHILNYDDPNRFIGFPGHKRDFSSNLKTHIIKWLEGLVKTNGKEKPGIPTNAGYAACCHC